MTDITTEQGERVLEGTWEEILAHSAEYAGKRLRVTVLASAGEADPGTAPANLADYLGTYVGSVKGGGEARSQETGRRFTEHLAHRRKERPS